MELARKIALMVVAARIQLLSRCHRQWVIGGEPIVSHSADGEMVQATESSNI